MSFWSRLFSPTPPPISRRVLDIETCRALLANALAGATQNNYRDIWSKATAATCIQADIETASRASFKPWSANVWECEDQARSLLESLQRTAAAAGHTRAAGMLFADPPEKQGDNRHVYIFALIGRSVAFYDPTAQQWCERPRNIYFSLL